MSKNPNKVVALSGGFDPLHIGHIQFFKDASEYGKVVVILNSDEWIIRKKGFCFMPWTERHRMITSIPWVSDVVKVGMLLPPSANSSRIILETVAQEKEQIHLRQK